MVVSKLNDPREHPDTLTQTAKPITDRKVREAKSERNDHGSQNNYCSSWDCALCWGAALAGTSHAQQILASPRIGGYAAGGPPDPIGAGGVGRPRSALTRTSTWPTPSACPVHTRRWCNRLFNSADEQRPNRRRSNDCNGKFRAGTRPPRNAGQAKSYATPAIKLASSELLALLSHRQPVTIPPRGGVPRSRMDADWKLPGSTGRQRRQWGSGLPTADDWPIQRPTYPTKSRSQRRWGPAKATSRPRPGRAVAEPRAGSAVPAGRFQTRSNAGP